MDHPKCRTCGERHRLGPCRQAAVSDKAAINDAYKKLAKEMNDALIGNVAKVATCPVCEARRIKQMAAQRGYRAKILLKKSTKGQ